MQTISSLISLRVGRWKWKLVDNKLRPVLQLWHWLAEYLLNFEINDLSQIAKSICLKVEISWRQTGACSATLTLACCKFSKNFIKYLSQIAKCICPKLQNIFVSTCKMYLSQIAKSICFKVEISWQQTGACSETLTLACCIFTQLFISYLSQIAKCICLKVPNIFVSSCKMYLSQITIVFVSKWKLVDDKLGPVLQLWHWLAS